MSRKRTPGGSEATQGLHFIGVHPEGQGRHRSDQGPEDDDPDRPNVRRSPNPSRSLEERSESAAAMLRAEGRQAGAEALMHSFSASYDLLAKIISGVAVGIAITVRVITGSAIVAALSPVFVALTVACSFGPKTPLPAFFRHFRNERYPRTETAAWRGRGGRHWLSGRTDREIPVQFSQTATGGQARIPACRSEEHTSELQSRQ